MVVLDVWSIFMAEAGWKEGEPLVGSKEIARNEVLEKLLSDGELLILRSSWKVSQEAGVAKTDTGLHFRPYAYRLLYDSIMDLIQKEWPDHAPDSLRFIYRPWPEAPK